MNAAIAGAEQTRAARPIEILQAPVFLSHFLAFLATDVKVSQGNRTRSLSWRVTFFGRGVVTSQRRDYPCYEKAAKL